MSSVIVHPAPVAQDSEVYLGSRTEDVIESAGVFDCRE